MNYKVLIAALLAATVVRADGKFHPPPQKWIAVPPAITGPSPCDIGVDALMLDTGQRNLSIACSAPVFSALRQPVQASALWGKRVRFSAWVRTEGVRAADMGGKGGAGLFIDYQEGEQPINALTEEDRLTGTGGWEFRELVVDVSRGGEWLSVGLWLRGQGQVWVRDMKFEEVPATVALTSGAPVAGGSGPVNLMATTALGAVPRGWETMGGGGPLTLRGSCSVGVDTAGSGNEQPWYTILCSNADVPSFGGLYRSHNYTRFLGKRVRISGWLRASGITDMRDAASGALVAGEAGLWMAVGSTSKGTRMDRMQPRAIRGTTDWEYRDFVVDIPEDNNRFQIGFWAQGRGQLWVRDLTVEEVPTTVPANFFWDDQSKPTGPDLSLE